MKYWSHIALLLAYLVLAGCGRQESNQLSGRILVWHSRSETETAALERTFEKFTDIYPSVRVISVSVPLDELRERYGRAAALGLGPDLFIGPSDWIPSLADAGVIRPISTLPVATDAYLPSALANASYRGELYGVPFSLHPVALYYNSKLVGEPAKTLSDLLSQADQGQNVAITTLFSKAFWGVQAFGGRLFDDDGQVILDRGGFAEWLNWLKKAQDAPGIFLSRDEATLLDLFLEQRVAYYVAGPEVLPIVWEKLGKENVGVVALPAGPDGPAGPFLRVDAFMFNKSSSERQLRVALALSQFLTNAEQSATLVREVGLVPANRRVRVDRRAYPAVSGFVAQSYTAVSVPNTPQMDLINKLGDSIYTQVLEGILDPTDAANEITQQVNEAFGFSDAVPTPVSQPIATRE